MDAQRKRVLITDTTMRDAHQSLLATRMRTRDIVGVAEAYSAACPSCCRVECWGGATFDVAMRFLNEPVGAPGADPRPGPNVLTQMLLRGANGVGYTNYPTTWCATSCSAPPREADGPVPHLRLPPLVDNMRVAIDAVLDTGKLAEGALCYTGDPGPARARVFAGLLHEDGQGTPKRPAATSSPSRTWRASSNRRRPRAGEGPARRVGLPVRPLDTSGISAATVLAAIDAGVDAVDGDGRHVGHDRPALPRLHRRGPCATASAPRPRSRAIRRISFWEAVRQQYAAFESDLQGAPPRCICTRCPAASSPTSRSRPARWASTPQHEVARAYRDANDLFGDIVQGHPVVQGGRRHGP